MGFSGSKLLFCHVLLINPLRLNSLTQRCSPRFLGPKCFGLNWLDFSQRKSNNFCPNRFSLKPVVYPIRVYLVSTDGFSNRLQTDAQIGFKPVSKVVWFALGTDLGLSGLTAYAGFIEICKPKKGEKVFVSAASGSVGNLVGQYAKILGCYVVGCAGSADKVKLLKEKLGFDEVFNYKEETDLNSTLERCFPDGIDIYFDNVGGKMLEAVISNMNLYGRVALCGVISEYKDVGKRASPNMLNVIYKRITIQGFLSGDYMHLFPEFISITVDHLRTRKMHMFEDISIGLESVPTAFVGLFREYNVGKKIVQASDDLGDK
ncbi:putative oxidoreductase [Helianthus debilis subsp. tardiflorus]